MMIRIRKSNFTASYFQTNLNVTEEESKQYATPKGGRNHLKIKICFRFNKQTCGYDAADEVLSSFKEPSFRLHYLSGHSKIAHKGQLLHFQESVSAPNWTTRIPSLNCGGCYGQWFTSRPIIWTIDNESFIGRPAVARNYPSLEIAIQQNHD